MSEVLVKTPGAGESPEEVAALAATDARSEDITWFNASFVKGLLAEFQEGRSYPVYLENDLVGFFITKSETAVKVVLAKDTKPLSLFLSSGMEFYFSVRPDSFFSDRDFTYGLVSENPIGQHSVKVRV